MTTHTIKKLVEQGANLILKDRILTNDLIEIVQLARGNGAKITITADQYTSQTLEDLLAIGGQNITIII